jgi:8-amino-3,8-dideoxy-alpha-D-manno-octulosonate transaminase
LYKTITCGDGGMLVIDTQDLYERCFALHDQGHLPLRHGIEIGQRPYLGLNLRMNEVSGAVLNAQLTKLDHILATLRTNKAAFRAAIETTPGVAFRRLTDPAGDIATHLVVVLPDADLAAAVARDLDTKTLSNSGWHVYANMEHLRSRRIVSGFASAVADYIADPGLLPATDALLARSITLGVGVVDAGIGSAFGINVRSSSTDIEKAADRFRTTVEHHLR